MRLPRSSGILMPVFSLPASGGIGDLGPCAYRFVDFLRSAGQTIWQLLPLGPPALGNSPYSSYSAFAGNPLLISLETLIEQGLLPQDYPVEISDLTDQINYDQVAAHKRPALRQAFACFQAGDFAELDAAFATFRQDNASWLGDFVLYEALVADTGSPDWSAWPDALVRYEHEAISAARARLTSQMEQSTFEQFLFHQQWQRLKQYANAANVRLYGDMPIFVAWESVDVWRHQDLFELDESGRPTVVAGVPPDYFSATGQMWGNPLYRWDRLQETNFDWWLARLEQAFAAFDILRLDHFRGFESYWEIPADAENAIHGVWKPGPKTSLFEAARAQFGHVCIVAEDLGLITEQVHQLRDTLNFPGMRVLQFGYDSVEDNYHRPEAWPPHSVAYTGTHDNETVAGWYRRRCDEGLDNSLLTGLLRDDQPVHMSLIQAVMMSAADTVVIPVQDLIGLDNGSRTNTPGVSAGNWIFRCTSEAQYTTLTDTLRQMTVQSERSSRLDNTD